MKGLYFNPKNKEIERIFERLMKYPVVRVSPSVSQSISRYKKVRYLNQNRKHPLIYINKGVVGLNPKLRIKRNGNGFDFDIF